MVLYITFSRVKIDGKIIHPNSKIFVERAKLTSSGFTKYLKKDIIWIVFSFKQREDFSVFFSVLSGCHFHLEFVFLSDGKFITTPMQDRKAPIMQTSAKSHIGHLEANAGQAGIIKCTLEMDFVLIFEV